jgi:predicted nucleic acid-binding protein
MILFLDACAIIYWVELVKPYYQQFSKKIDKIKKNYHLVTFAASELSLLECRIKPLRENNDILLSHYQVFFNASDLKLVPLNRSVIELASHLRVQFNLTTPDALQAASALSFSDEIIFVSGDTCFKKIPGLKVEII